MKKPGLISTYNKKMTTTLNNEVWTALNMTLDKEKWVKNYKYKHS